MKVIFIFIAKAIFGLLVQNGVRWIVERLHFSRFHEWILQKLEYKINRPSNDALTEKEIIDLEIIKSTDSSVITEKTKKRIQKQIAHWGLIKREWDDILSKPLTFKWKEFFIRFNPLWAETILPLLNEQYDGINVACFAILPFPRKKKHRPLEFFLHRFEKCLGEQSVFKEYIAPGMLGQKITSQWLRKLNKHEKILILQPFALNDDYLEITIDYIKNHSMAPIHEIITFVDGSGRTDTTRSDTPPERVLLELDLSKQMNIIREEANE